MSSLPLVVTIKINIKELATTEGIALSETNSQARTRTATCASFVICLYIHIIRLVKDTRKV